MLIRLKYVLLLSLAVLALAASAPPPAQAQTYYGAGHTYCPAEIQNIIRAAWPDDAEEMAIEIAWRESGCDPSVMSYAAGYGLFQIVPIAAQAVGADWYSLGDPYYNAQIAAQLYDAYGWNPWAATYY